MTPFTIGSGFADIISRREKFLQSITSRVTIISENEINIRNPLCNVRHLNGMLNVPLEIFPKKTH